MSRTLTWILAGVLLLLFAVPLIMLGRALSLQAAEVKVEPPAEEVTVEPDVVARRLAKALQFRTVSRHPPAEADPQPFLAFHAYLQQQFPRVHRLLERETVGGHSLLFRWPGRDSALQPVLLMAHQDVVPVAPATRDEWRYPPFAGKIADGKIWGRGALDVKSGLMGILEAVERLLQEGYIPARDLYLFFGHDEEVGGLAGAAAAARLLAERDVRFEFILDEGGFIVREGMIRGVDRPVAMIGVAEKGYLSLRLAAQGSGGHSSMPPRHTAIGRLSRAITRLEANPFPGEFRFAEMTFAAITPQMSFVQRLLLGNLWLTQPLVEWFLSRSPSSDAVLRTTQAATLVEGGVQENVLPPRAQATVNLRILPGETVESVQARVRRVVDDSAVQITPLGEPRNPPPISPRDHAYQLLQHTIHQISGEQGLVVAPYVVLGGTDSYHFRQLTPRIYRFIPLQLTPKTAQLVHGVNERVPIDSYVELIRFYYQLVRNLEAPLSR